MGRSLHCTDCGQTTNHARPGAGGFMLREHDLDVYSCKRCSKLRTEDETDNQWLRLAEVAYQRGKNLGRRDASSNLDLDSTDPEYWIATEGLDREEAEQRAEEKQQQRKLP